MKTNRACIRKRLLATSVIVSAIAASPVHANTEEPQDTEVVTTGSRLPAATSNSGSPVATYGAEAFRLQGAIRAEDFINGLPIAFGDQGGHLSLGASGTATANLRGLGPQRTLVLINGRRLMAGDPTLPSSDLNFIPTLMLERVEVQTGGASVAYGSDAAAGVVNFILDTNFEGARLAAQYGFYQHDNDDSAGLAAALNRRGWTAPQGGTVDGFTYDASAAVGAKFGDDRGHVSLYAGYRKIEGVTQGERDYSFCATQARSPSQVAADPTRLVDCGGSATSANGTIFTWDDVGGLGDTFQIGPNRTLVPGITNYNFAPDNHLQRPDERFTFGIFANYEITTTLKPYVELMYMRDRTEAQVTPSGNFGNTITINCGAPGSPAAVSPGIGNPLLSAQQRSILCATGNLVDADEFFNGPVHHFIDPTTGLAYTRGFAQVLRRNVEGGPRIEELEHTGLHFVAGLRGDLGGNWTYDAFYQYGRTEFDLAYLNDFSVSRLSRALDVIDDPRTPGVDPICRSVLSGADPNCVPWDIFAAGQVSDAALAYLQPVARQNGSTQLHVFNASVTGHLDSLKTPWVSNGATVVLGLEYRKERLDFDADDNFQLRDLAAVANAVVPVSGDFDVREMFFEMRLPIIEGGAVHELSLEGGYRYSDYALGTRNVDANAYRIGVNFAPAPGVRAHASYNRAIRAPNIQELFDPQRVVFNGSGDPCAGAFPFAPLAACQAMGVSAAQYGTIDWNLAGQYNGLIGGNPDLAPEIADTFTIGVVVNPDFIDGLVFSIDYFSIKVDDTVRRIGQDTILSTCVDTQDPFFCSLVQRDQFGSLWRTGGGFVRDIVQNVGHVETRGVDIGVSYALRLDGVGEFAFDLQGTWLDSLEIYDGYAEAYDCAGSYGLVCGTPKPEWRHRARLSYASPDGLGVSVQWRYVAGVDDEKSDPHPMLSGTVAPYNAHIPAQSYIDLALTARFGDAYTLRFGVNNVFDKAPPLIGAAGGGNFASCPETTCSANTFPNVYDPLGRYVFTSVSIEF